MFTNKLILLAFAVSVPLLLVLQQVKSASVFRTNNNNNYDLLENPTVYRRFIRRRPAMHPHDKYSDTVIEIFRTKEKPPEALLTDNDIDKFIFCDFNRHLEECKKYWEYRRSIRPIPKPSTLSDEDIDRFIFCDFNRHLEECKKYWDSRRFNRPKPFTPSTTTVANKEVTTASTLEPIYIRPIITTTTTETTPVNEYTTDVFKIHQLEEEYNDYNDHTKDSGEEVIENDNENDDYYGVN